MFKLFSINISLMRIILILGIFSISITTKSLAEERKTLQVVHAHFPPYMIENGELAGFIIDIEREIFEKAGYNINFKTLPYTRALSQAAKGNVDFMGATVPMAVEGLKYPEQEVAVMDYVFVVKKGNEWRYKGVDSVKDLKLGNLKLYNYSPISKEYNDLLHSEGADVTTLYGNTATESMLKMIEMERVDTYSEAKYHLQYIMAENSINDKYEFAGSLGKPLLIKPGFPVSLEQSDELLSVFEAGMKRIKSDGTLQKIMDKYGLTAW